MQAQKLIDKPVPLWLIHISSGDHFRPPNEIHLDQCDDALRICVFRSVDPSKLRTVLRNGIDVEPTNAVIYVSHDLEKAWEYGAFPKLVLALEQQKLSQTFCEVPTDLSKAELEPLRLRLPNVIQSIDGKKLYLSRLSCDDPRINTDYEWTYARWIEGNPFEALRGLYLFARPEDRTTVANIAQQAILHQST